jgi:hypothetical protein
MSSSGLVKPNQTDIEKIKSQYEIKVAKAEFSCYTAWMAIPFTVSFTTVFFTNIWTWSIISSIYFGVAILIYVSIYIRLDSSIMESYINNYIGKPFYLCLMCWGWLGIVWIVHEHNTITNLKKNYTVHKVMNS